MLSDELKKAIEGIVDGWYADSRIDWDDLPYRLERWGFDIDEDMSSSQIKTIQKYAREYKKL